MNPHLLEIFVTKLRYNLKSEIARTYLGYLWWLIEPALYVAILYYVFAIFLNRGGNNYVAFLVCGQVPYLWFSKSILQSCNAINVGRGLINQVAIPKAFFPLLTVFQASVKQCFVFGLMFVFLIIYGMEPGLDWLWVAFVILAQQLVILPLALIAAILTTFVPDFRFLIETGMVLVMFASGIFYSYKDVLLPEHQEMFLLNPMARLIKNYRQVLMDHQPPDWWPLMLTALISVLLLVVMLRVYRRADNALARLVAT